METTPTVSGMNRRDLLKKGAVAGGVVWVAPTVFAEAASAATTYGECVGCPDGKLYGVKNDSSSGEDLVCLPDEQNPATCITLPANVECGTCFDGAGLNVTAANGCTTYTLGPSLEFCAAASKGSNAVGCTETTVTATKDSETGVTTVEVCQDTQSHTELIFCYRGSPPAPC